VSNINWDIWVLMYWECNLCCSVSDNVFAVKTWVKNKLAVEEAVIDKQFDIPETFDYIEWMMMQVTDNKRLVVFHRLCCPTRWVCCYKLHKLELIVVLLTLSFVLCMISQFSAHETGTLWTVCTVRVCKFV